MPLFTSLVGFWFFSLPFPRPLKLGRGNAAKGSEKRDTLNGPLRLSNPERKVRAQFVFGIGSIAEGNFRGSKGFLTSMDRGLIIWLQNEFLTGEEKKLKNQKNQKKITKKIKPVKKPIRIFKNQPIRFYKPKTEKTRKNRAKPKTNRAKQEKTRAKSEKTKSNRFEPVFVLK